MAKILLIGAGGQVGQELIPILQPLGTLVTIGRQELDLTQLEQISPLIQDLAPTIIVNAAAYTAVDRAESAPELAQLVNTEAPRAIATTAQKLGATMVHLSTDYVFGGNQCRPYREEDATAPLGVYGQTKRAGELAIIDSGCRSLIVRTAWLYGSHGRSNFVKTMVRLGQTKSQIGVVADQIGSPTWAQDLALAIARLTEQGAMGIFHYSNSGVASWYDFAMAIFAEAEQLGLPLQVDKVIPLTTEQYPTPAQRPAYSVLSHQKLVAELGEYPPHWRQSLRAMLQEGLVVH